ncbi:MAG: YmdB family metallophosphoesterase [Oscillospiraceae bacterium]|nr:YmdB family metallophosphoesterase [Oscillospiraceae bacterium]
MNLLFLGDVIGSLGCEFVASKISGIKKEYDIAVTVINGENSANGNGVLPQSAKFLLANGADVITTGNHCYKRREMHALYDKSKFILRPANFPAGNPGRGVCVYKAGEAKVAVVSLMGTIYMDALDNPFDTMDKIISELETPNIFVDFHAEATAEKKAMGHYLAERVTGVLGTHTHVQTADEIILKEHTAYITDAGMCGAELSVLGVEIENAVLKMRLHSPFRLTESANPAFINGVVVDFDEKTGRARSIKRLIIR